MTSPPPTIRILALVLAWCILAIYGNSVTWAAPQQSVASFQREVKKRFNKDQTARHPLDKLMRREQEGKPLTEKDKHRKNRLAQRAIDIDADNVKWLKKHLSKHGLPAPSLIGPDTTEHMFVMLIHADRNREFQKQCIKLMETAPDDWPARYPQTLKTRMAITASMNLPQTEDAENNKQKEAAKKQPNAATGSEEQKVPTPPNATTTPTTNAQ